MAASFMAYNVGTVTPVKLCTVGPATTVVLTSNENSADVYLGGGTTVSVNSGAIMPPNQSTTIINPATASAFDLWAISGTGSHDVGVIVITAHR